MRLQVVILFRNKNCVLHVSMSNEYVLPLQPHLSRSDYPTLLGLLLVRIEHVVLAFKCNPDSALFRAAYNHEIRGTRSSATVEVVGPRLWPEVFLSAQKESICFRF